MFWRKSSNFTQLGARSWHKMVQGEDALKIALCLRRRSRCFASESALNAITLRLWSYSGGEHVLSTPFDDLGAWHSAEAKSFLHNVG